MSCSNFQVRQLWWTVSLLSREKCFVCCFFFLLNPQETLGIPIQVTRGMSLAVEGIRAAVRVAAVTNQKSRSCF